MCNEYRIRIKCKHYFTGCTPQNCVFSPWRPWTSCYFEIQITVRTVRRQASCGGTCLGARFKSRLCTVTRCEPINCVYTWGPWSRCFSEIQTRTRTILFAVPAHCTSTCAGGLSETRSCVTSKGNN